MEVLQSNARSEGEAFIQAARSGLAKALHKIEHCLSQLDDQQLWHRPRPEMNSIANLILHVCGNLRQWIVSGVGGAPDVRQRQAEFDDRSMRPRQQLLDHLRQTIRECDDTLAKVNSSTLTETRRIEGFERQAIAAIFDTISHLQGHVQEIIHMTRAQLGDRYRFDFVPRNKEQGGA